MDRGFENRKPEGLLCNAATRKGMWRSRPFDQEWTAENRKRGGRGDAGAGTVTERWQFHRRWGFLVGEIGEKRDRAKLDSGLALGAR